MGEIVKHFRDLRVYQAALEAAMEIFEITRNYPQEERYSLVDQIRRSSRSVCTNIAEAWRKRRYKAAFIAKLNDSEAEGCETQVLLEISKKCGYLNEDMFNRLDGRYEHIQAQIVLMIERADQWLIKSRK